ncbi:pentatricopeptide repeat-containing protein [Hordeum vulgare]|nr:pentatricopeptide repeat-containing protein [Hordeum vulgare]
MSVKPSRFTFKSVLEVCNLTNVLHFGRLIHAHVIFNGYGFQDDEFIANALINLYSKARSVSDSLRCFHMTPRQDVVTWTSIITAFAHDENFEKALGLFLEFLSLGKEPDQFTLSSVMNACAALSLPATCDVEASEKTFEQITCLDIFSWSAMVLRGEEEAIA